MTLGADSKAPPLPDGARFGLIKAKVSKATLGHHGLMQKKNGEMFNVVRLSENALDLVELKHGMLRC